MGDEFDSYVPGPLDEIAPGLRRKAERWQPLPVHPRVVHARGPAGERTIVLASFCEPASTRALHAALKPVIEAALLAELSRPPAELAADEGSVAGLELYTFARFQHDHTPALAPFGLAVAELEEPAAARALALLRHEAQHVEGLVKDEAHRRYRAPLASSPHPLAAPLATGLRALAAKAGWGPWGAQPGALARACADLLSELGQPGVEPTRAGIERLEAIVVHPTEQVIRWIDPLCFQALCDLVAVTATVTYEQSVQWGVCEPDAETKLAPPPLLRVDKPRESFHVPLGEHVLRWCVMPRSAGEVIPSLGAWAEHEFT